MATQNLQFYRNNQNLSRSAISLGKAASELAVLNASNTTSLILPTSVMTRLSL